MKLAFFLKMIVIAALTIVVEVFKKRSERQAQLVQMLMAHVQTSTANAAAARTQADAALAARAAHPANSKRFKPAPPPKFENKNKDLEIRKWMPVVEKHYEGCPPEHYLRLASSHLSGKPRSFHQSKYNAFKASGAVMADPRAFFSDTMLSDYGMKERSQTFWDTWHKLRQVPGEDISEYNNSAFEQVHTDLSCEITNKQVKIEKYKSGLVDLRKLARVAPSGKRWTSLADLISYCTLQWPTIKVRLERKGGFAKPAVKKTAGKCKMSLGRRGKGNFGNDSGQNSGKMSEEQRARHICNKLYMICHKVWPHQS
jgi:hypothetical protein